MFSVMVSAISHIVFNNITSGIQNSQVWIKVCVCESKRVTNNSKKINFKIVEDSFKIDKEVTGYLTSICEETRQKM